MSGDNYSSDNDTPAHCDSVYHALACVPCPSVEMFLRYNLGIPVAGFQFFA
jgi:hypothetical protein